MIGKEIVRFHCVYWPAFLMAAGLPVPKTIVAHGWLLFEESKMSKSARQHRAHGDDSRRAGRGCLAIFSAAGSRVWAGRILSFDALVQRYNSDLANGLGNLASRTLTMINRYFKGEVPYPSHAGVENRSRRCDCQCGAEHHSRIWNSVRSISVFTRAGSGVGADSFSG